MRNVAEAKLDVCLYVEYVHLLMQHLAYSMNTGFTTANLLAAFPFEMIR
jgi:hypothetical protein